MYKSMEECVLDLEKHGHLVRIKHEVDPNLEMAEIHRRFFDAGGPAVLFEKVKGSPYRAVSNIYGTFERTDFIFRKTFKKVQKVIELKADPTNLLKNPLRYIGAPFTALSALPMKNWGKAPVTFEETTIDKLPLVKSWPMDGGAFVTLPQVFTLPPNEQNVMKSNIGMYRIQLSGNDYKLNKEIGLHYQLHRGIGVHHTEYNNSDEPFRCCCFIGGPPSHAFAAIMPLPEGLSEVTFAGLLGGRRFRYVNKDGFTISADADFVITGIVRKGEKMPEGPFGDHLGYYSLQHDFPVMDVEKVYARKNAIWQFSVVGRPPAEDSSFGYMIHKLVSPLLSGEFPGVKEINAVDAAGVHPLLLAIGSERYMPFRERKPEEILIQANRILGSGQTSLAKFLLIAAHADDPNLSAEDIPTYFNHMLERVDWTRDLHFQTKTTIDTLDYSGDGWNAGSKVIIAACGDKVRTLTDQLPTNFELPDGFKNPVFVQKGILAVEGQEFTGKESYADVDVLCKHLEQYELDSIPLILFVDDSAFVAETVNNYVWVTYTRANPSHDIHGVKPFIEHKHWGCKSALVIDARIKPHHAPPLVKDPDVTAKVDALFAEGGLLYGTL